MEESSDRPDIQPIVVAVYTYLRSCYGTAIDMNTMDVIRDVCICLGKIECRGLSENTGS